MAFLQQRYPNIAKVLCIEPSCGYRARKHDRIRPTDCGKSRRNAGHLASYCERTVILEKERSSDFRSYCSPFPFPSAEVEMDATYEKEEGQYEWLVSEHGWKVRRLVQRDDEMRKVAQVQAEAFHIPMIFFDDLFFQYFQAEVLSGLLYRFRNSAPDRYACLVAEPNDAPESEQELVGVVDVTVLRDNAILQYLPGAEEYLYVSGIAVLNNFRRQKVATVLLKACDVLAILWGFEYLVLRAYEDDMGARQLYTNGGYRVVGGDPPWMTTWIGRKRRILMIKQLNQS